MPFGTDPFTVGRKLSVTATATGLSRLTWTALDVGGPCVEAFGMNIRDGAPAALQGRELQEARLALFK